MTTWTTATSASTTYSSPSDEENNYVVAGYVVNDYISGAQIWNAAGNATTTWAAA